VRETRDFALHEAGRLQKDPAQPTASFRFVFTRVTWQDPAFFRLSQAGFVSNLNDVVTWGLLPPLAVQRGSTVQEAALLGGTCLAVWGASQIGTGPLSDRVGRVPLIAGGLWLQALGIALLEVLTDACGWALAVVLMGTGNGDGLPRPARRGERPGPPLLAGFRAGGLPVVERQRLRGRRAGLSAAARFCSPQPSVRYPVRAVTGRYARPAPCPLGPSGLTFS